MEKYPDIIIITKLLNLNEKNKEFIANEAIRLNKKGIDVYIFRTNFAALLAREDDGTIMLDSDLNMKTTLEYNGGKTFKDLIEEYECLHIRGNNWKKQN